MHRNTVGTCSCSCGQRTASDSTPIACFLGKVFWEWSLCSVQLLFPSHIQDLCLSKEDKQD